MSIAIVSCQGLPPLCGCARLWRQFSERFPVETGKRKGDTAGLAEGDDPPPVEVEQLVQLHQIAGHSHSDERCSDDAVMHQVQHRQQQERLVRRFALSGVGPRRAGVAVKGGEVFDGGGEVGHVIFF